MKKALLLLVVNMVTIKMSFSQINYGLRQTDSLKHALSIARQDTSRASLMASLAEAYRWSKPDSALLYAQRALTLSRQIKFSRGEAAALVSLSVLQRELGNLALALDLALKALQISRENHFHYEELGSLIRIANAYSASNNYEEALNYFRQAKKKLNSFPDPFFMASTAILTAITFERMNKLDSALYYAKSISLDEFKNTTGLAIYYFLLGNIQGKLKNETLALNYYQQGLDSAAKYSDYRTASEINIKLASIFKKNNQPDSAIYYAKKGLETAQLLSYKNRIMSASSLLAELYESRHAEEAIKFYKIFSAARDSLYSIEKMQAMQTMTFNEQERRHEIEKANTAYRNKIQVYLLIGGLIIFLIITTILYRNNKHKQKANTLLHKQKLEIDTQKTKLQESLDNLKSTQAQLIQSEKMASLGELTAGIAHEIQNPLNFINNFSEVNKELIEEMKSELKSGNSDEAIFIAHNISDNEQKINQHGKRADAIVKGMLQHSRSSNGVKEPTDINALANEYLRLSYHGLRAKDNSFNATIKTDFDEKVDKININPQDMGRVLLNLYNNAFHAVSEKKASIQRQAQNKLNSAAQLYEPTVIVTTRPIKPPLRGWGVSISVQDNGNGIPRQILDKIFQPFFTTKPTGQGTGLGLSLAYDIIKAHGGELRVETKEGETAEFIILLPR